MPDRTEPAESARLSPTAHSAWPIRSYLLGFGLALVIPIIGLGLAILLDQTSKQRLAFEGRIKRLAQEVALDMDREIAGLIEVLQVLGVSPVLSDGNLVRFREFAERVHQMRQVDVVLVSPDGRPILHTAVPPETPLPEQYPTPPLLVTTKDDIQVSGVYKEPMLRRPAIGISVPVIGGSFSGHSLRLLVEPARLASVFSFSTLPLPWYVDVRDPGAVLVVSSHPRHASGDAGRVHPGMASDNGILRGAGTGEDAALIGYARSRLTGWIVSLVAPVDEQQITASGQFLSLAALTALLVGGSIGLAHWFARVIATPVGALAQHANSLDALAPVAHPAKTYRVREVNDVIRRLDETAHRLRAGTAQLKLSEERYRHLAAATPAGLFRTDPGGRCIFANERLSEMSGRTSAASLLGTSWLDLVEASQRPAIAQAWERSRAEGRLLQQEFVLSRPDGAVIWGLCEIVLEAGGETPDAGFAGSISDITDRKAAEASLAEINATLEDRVLVRTQELADANRRLKQEMLEKEVTQAALTQAQKLEALGQLTSSVAHDFNNQLMAILGGLELVQRRLTDPNMLRHVRNARAAARRASQLTDQLLSFARRSELAPQIVDISEAFHELEELLRHAIGPDIARSVELPHDLRPVWVDPDRLHATMLNIAINARDAMPADGHGRISISASNVAADAPDRPPGLACGDAVRLRVADNGRGMTADVLARASEPFFTTKPRGKGTGLGLAMARRFAETSHGILEIKSEAGRGTIVDIYLPAADRAAELRRAPEVLPQASATSSDLAVICVDDDRQAVETAAELLRELGLELICTTDPAVAIKAAEELDRLDLLVTDIDMPETDGGELALKLRQRFPRLKVLFITGHAEHQRGKLCDGLGDEAVRVLKKPFGSQDLAAAIFHLLGKARDEGAESDRAYEST